MKKLLDKWISISLIKRIIGGLALGIILGLLVPKASGIALFGSVFVGALKAIAPLLVFVLVISSLCHSGKSHGGVIKTVIILYMFSTILASVIAVFTSKLFPVTLTLTEGIEEMSSPGSIGDVFNSLLMNIVENPITSLTKANYVGILAWAVVIGIACRHAKESTKDMLVDISNGLSKVVTWIINFAPFGIMGLVFDTVSNNGMSVFKEYGKLLMLLVGTMLFIYFVTNPILVFWCTHKNPYPLVFRCLKKSALTAFFTRSSAANIPINMKECEDMELDRDTYSVTIPLGDLKLSKYIPNLEKTLYSYSDRLTKLEKSAVKWSDSDKNVAVMSSLIIAAKQLKSLADSPDSIPYRIDELSTSSNSVNHYLATTIDNLIANDLAIDRIYIYQDGAKLPSKPGFFKSCAMNVSRFVESFTDSTQFF